MKSVRMLLTATCSAVVTMAAMASAGAIAVPDGGFEMSTAKGWVQFDQPTSGKWAISDTGGDWWGSGVYTAASDGGAHGSPSEGSNFLQVYPGNNLGGPGTYGTATLSLAAFPVTTTVGNKYTAAVDIALALDAGVKNQAGCPSVTINLMEGTNVLASGTGTVGAPGVWGNVGALPYTATDSAVHNLSIQIVATNFYGTGGYTATSLNLDNVTVTEAPVPEPGTLAVVGMSALGLLSRRRK
jgi:hypothetical protein